MFSNDFSEAWDALICRISRISACLLIFTSDLCEGVSNSDFLWSKSGEKIIFPPQFLAIMHK